MTFTEKYTDEEQLRLLATPVLIGSAMAMAESSSLATIKELMASAKTYMGGLKAYPQNEIIQGILPNLDDRKEAMAQTRTMHGLFEKLRKKPPRKRARNIMSGPFPSRRMLPGRLRRAASLGLVASVSAQVKKRCSQNWHTL